MLCFAWFPTESHPQCTLFYEHSSFIAHLPYNTLVLRPPFPVHLVPPAPIGCVVLFSPAAFLVQQPLSDLGSIPYPSTSPPCRLISLLCFRKPAFFVPFRSSAASGHPVFHMRTGALYPLLLPRVTQRNRVSTPSTPLIRATR